MNPVRLRSLRLVLAAILLGSAGAACGPKPEPATPQALESVKAESRLRDLAKSRPSEPSPTLDLIAFLLDNQRPNDALDEARRARERFPEAPAVREALAEASFATGRMEEAIAELRSLKTQSRHRLRLARLLVRSGRGAEAVRLLDEERPGTSGERLQLAQVFLDALRPDRAAATLKPGLRQATGNLDYQVTCGVALLSVGDYRGAVGVLQPAAHAQPEVPAVQFYLGSALRLSGDLSRLPAAETHLRRAAELSPKDALYHYELGLARAQLRDRHGAETALTQAAELGPELPEAQRDLARILKILKKPVEAAAAQARYLRLVDDAPGAVKLLAPVFAADPGNREAGLALSAAQHASGKFKDAVATLDQLHQREPQEPTILWAQFRLRRSLQQYKEAAEALDALERLSPNDPTFLEERADLFERLSQYQQAEKLLVKLCDLEPASAFRRYRLGYGQALWFRDPAKQQEAEANLRKALELDPELPDAHYGLALVLQTSKPNEAIEHARRALDRRPANQDGLRVLARACQAAGDREGAEEAFGLLKKVQARAAEQGKLQLPVNQLRNVERSRMALARYHLRVGDYASATRELERLQHAFPANAEARSLLRPLYAHARRFQRHFEERSGAPR